MRRSKLVSLRKWILAIALLPGLGQAQAAPEDVEALREEMDALRREYDERIADLEARLIDMAAAATQASTLQAEAPSAVPPPPRVSTVASVNAFNPAVGVILDAKWRDLSAGGTNDTVAGFPLAEEAGVGDEGLSLGESELNFYANIDSRVYGSATLAFVDEDGESAVEIEEAFIETLALPAGLSLKAGRMFSSIGYLNGQHSHTDDFVDRPLPYRALLNGQFGDDGVQLRWLAPTPVFFEVGGELLRGEGYPIAGATNGGKGAWTAFTHVGGDVGASHSWRAGVSVLSGTAQDRQAAGTSFTGDVDMNIFDFVWKWAPNGNATVRNFKLQTEYMQKRERGILSEAGNQGPLDVDQSGWYLQSVYQFRPQWRVGLRWSTLSPDDPGALFSGGTYDANEHDPRHASAMIDWSTSEFGRVRLQYNRDSSRMEPEDQWLLQYVMSVGAHGAHQF